MNLTGSIVFSSGKEADYDIFTLDLPTGQVSQLTSGPYWNDFAKWSPDGSQILFISNRTGTQDIWLMDADGKNQRALTKPGQWHAYPSWAPDGQSIVFSANYDGNVNIFRMGINGSNLQQLTFEKAMDYHPRFSPDGLKIIFTSKRTGNPDVWEYQCQSGAFVQLTRWEGRDCAPVYSPSGTRIAFISGLVGEDGHENTELYLLAPGGQPERLTANVGQDRFVTWSPDGKYLLFSSSYGPHRAERLTVMDMQSRKKETLKFDRTKLELEVEAEAKGTLFFRYLPKSFLKVFYPHQFFGAERYPDWKY